MSRNLERRRAFLFPIALALIPFVCSLSIEAQSRTTQKAQQTKMTADGLLALGDFYLKNDDVTDAADRYYKQVTNSFPGTRQAGVAQYKRGSYWQKKFYILREKNGAKDRVVQSALIEAEGQYYDFIDKFAEKTNTTDLMADAAFNLALVYLQRNNPNYAVGWFNRMLYGINKRDGQVYIYRVVWSSNPADVVDRNVDSNGLAKVTRDAISSGLSVDQIVSQVKQWCRKQ